MAGQKSGCAIIGWILAVAVIALIVTIGGCAFMGYSSGKESIRQANQKKSADR